jgi:hypothetical protein
VKVGAVEAAVNNECGGFEGVAVLMDEYYGNGIVA